MPRGDGTDPAGSGQGTGMSQGRGGQGRGRMGGNRAGAGPTDYCICPSCGEKTTHKLGTPCNQMTCPKCGTKLMRA